MMRLESLGSGQQGPVTEAWGAAAAATTESGRVRGAPLNVQIPGEVPNVGGAGINSHVVRRERSRFAMLVSQVSSPSQLIKARVSRAASSLLSEVDEDESLIFARRMQSAFLLFLSWAYMALAQINVEYYTCSATGDGRYVLDMDPTVECWVGWHQALWLPAMAGTLFYVIGGAGGKLSSFDPYGLKGVRFQIVKGVN